MRAGCGARTESGEYTAILHGAYPRREDDATATVSQAAQDAAQSCSASFARTPDTLGRLVHDVAGFMGSAKLWIDEKLGSRGTE